MVVGVGKWFVLVCDCCNGCALDWVLIQRQLKRKNTKHIHERAQIYTTDCPNTRQQIVCPCFMFVFLCFYVCVSTLCVFTFYVCVFTFCVCVFMFLRFVFVCHETCHNRCLLCEKLCECQCKIGAVYWFRVGVYDATGAALGDCRGMVVECQYASTDICTTDIICIN